GVRPSISRAANSYPTFAARMLSSPISAPPEVVVDHLGKDVDVAANGEDRGTDGYRVRDDAKAAGLVLAAELFQRFPQKLEERHADERDVASLSPSGIELAGGVVDDDAAGQHLRDVAAEAPRIGELEVGVAGQALEIECDENVDAVEDRMPVL